MRKYLSNIRKKFFLPYRIDGRGERVHIDATQLLTFENMDIYQKSHIKRYQFAQSYIKPNDVCGDFACGTAYGTVLIAAKGKEAVGADINGRVVRQIQDRYKDNAKVSFIKKNLLNLKYKNYFDIIVSFETIEHFKEKKIPKLFSRFNQALKSDGLFIFSTPYLQEQSKAAIEAGYHLTFNIDEVKISKWLQDSGFSDAQFFYQNYTTHDIKTDISPKDFILCIARKK